MKLMRSIAFMALVAATLAQNNSPEAPPQPAAPASSAGGAEPPAESQKQTVVDGTLGAGVHALTENVIYLKKRVYSTGMWLFGASRYIGSPVARIGYPRAMNGEEGGDQQPQEVEVDASGETNPAQPNSRHRILYDSDMWAARQESYQRRIDSRMNTMHNRVDQKKENFENSGWANNENQGILDNLSGDSSSSSSTTSGGEAAAAPFVDPVPVDPDTPSTSTDGEVVQVQSVGAKNAVSLEAADTMSAIDPSRSQARVANVNNDWIGDANTKSSIAGKTVARGVNSVERVAARGAAVGVRAVNWAADRVERGAETKLDNIELRNEYNSRKLRGQK